MSVTRQNQQTPFLQRVSPSIQVLAHPLAFVLAVLGSFRKHQGFLLAGAIAYNAGHSTVGPALLAAVALVTGRAGLLPVALIWVAHIGFDRMLGYGLKYATAFGATHLGRVGRRAA